MRRRRTSSSLSRNGTGFPDDFIGTTQRHPEALVLTTPWEPKEVDLARRARKLSMLRQQAMHASALSLNEYDEELDDDYYSSEGLSPKTIPHPASRAHAKVPAPGGLTIPVYPEASRVTTATESASPTASDCIDTAYTSPFRAIYQGMAPTGATDALALGRGHIHQRFTKGFTIGRARGQSHDSTTSETSISPHSPSTAEGSGWTTWAAKVGEWKSESKQKRIDQRRKSKGTESDRS